MANATTVFSPVRKNLFRALPLCCCTIFKCQPFHADKQRQQRTSHSMQSLRTSPPTLLHVLLSATITTRGTPTAHASAMPWLPVREQLPVLRTHINLTATHATSGESSSVGSVPRGEARPRTTLGPAVSPSSRSSTLSLPFTHPCARSHHGAHAYLASQLAPIFGRECARRSIHHGADDESFVPTCGGRGDDGDEGGGVSLCNCGR